MFLWFLATFCAFFVKGMCGFADTLVFTGILSFTQATSLIVPMTVLVGYCANLIVLIKNRRLVRPKPCLPVIVPMMLGEIPGAFMLAKFDSAWLKIALGVVIASIGVQQLLPKKGEKKELSAIYMWCSGVLSGLVCGLFGIGVAIAAAVNYIFDDPHEAKANVAFVFLFDTTFRLVLYAMNGLVTMERVKLAGVLWIVMLIAVVAGLKVSEKLNTANARRLIQFMLIISGVSLVITNLGAI